MVDVLFILLIAFVFSVFMTGSAGWTHPRDQSAVSGTIFLFLVFGLLIWAVSVWIEPAGPEVLGFAWAAPLVTGLILALLLLAVSVPSRTSDEEKITKSSGVLRPSSGPPGRAFGVFFWILLVALVLLLLGGLAP